MDRTEIQERVCEVVSDLFGVSVQDATLDARLIEDLEAELVQKVELAAALEDEFDIEIDEEDALGWETVGDALDVVLECLDEIEQ